LHKLISLYFLNPIESGGIFVLIDLQQTYRAIKAGIRFFQTSNTKNARRKHQKDTTIRQ
jgi:hypothetical protein